MSSAFRALIGLFEGVKPSTLIFTSAQSKKNKIPFRHGH